MSPIKTYVCHPGEEKENTPHSSVLPLLKKLAVGAMVITMVGVYAYMALVLLMYII